MGLWVSPNKVVSLEGLHTYLGCFLIYYGIANNSKASNRYWVLMGGILCMIMLGVTAYTFSQGIGREVFFNEWAWDIAEPLPKLATPGFTMNEVGMVLGTALPLLFAITLFTQSPRIRLVTGILSLGFFGLLIMSASAGGWISVTFGLVFVILCWRIWTIGFIMPTIGIAGCAAAYLWARSSTFPELVVLRSITSRADIWANTLSLLGQHPLTGCGIGMWFELYRPYEQWTVINPHNGYLQLYADTGIAGGLALILAAITFVMLSRRILLGSKESQWFGVAIGAMGSIMAGGINAFFEVEISTPLIESDTLYHYIAVPYLWIWPALLAIAYEHLRAGSCMKDKLFPTIPSILRFQGFRHTHKSP